MNKEMESLNLLIEQGIFPLYFNEDATVSIEIMRALTRAGYKAIEYTNRDTAAFENFKKLIAVRDKEIPEMLLGIGTVKNAEQAKAYINAGADLIVTPGIDATVGSVTHNAGLLWVPGCMTATEIMLAEQCNAKLVKIFPGSLVGPSYITAMKDVFRKLLFMPSGGVDTSAENIAAWFNAGVSLVGMGSKLISKSLMEKKDYDAIEMLARNVLQTVQQIKKVTE